MIKLTKRIIKIVFREPPTEKNKTTNLKSTQIRNGKQLDI